MHEEAGDAESRFRDANSAWILFWERQNIPWSLGRYPTPVVCLDIDLVGVRECWCWGVKFNAVRVKPGIIILWSWTGCDLWRSESRNNGEDSSVIGACSDCSIIVEDQAGNRRLCGGENHWVYHATWATMSDVKSILDACNLERMADLPLEEAWPLVDIVLLWDSEINPWVEIQVKSDFTDQLVCFIKSI